jgi:mRNA interferase MazF
MPDFSFRQGDVVRVPFPYTDKATRQHRPALVVSHGDLGESQPLLWVAMITSAENRRWPDDQAIDDLAQAGLPSPSVVRPAKIATIEARHAEPLGQVPPDVMVQISQTLGRYLGVIRS